MFFLVILVIGLIAWGVVRLVDPADNVQVVGVCLTVVGAISTVLMWWLRVPELILAVGVATLAVGKLRARRVTRRPSSSV